MNETGFPNIASSCSSAQTKTWKELSLAKSAKPVKLSRHSKAQPIGGQLTHVTHSKMLETRRRREKAKKDFAGAAKRAKNLAKRNAKKARAAATKPA
jgi:hypothetical protein